MKSLAWICLLALVLAGCGSKPSYSDQAESAQPPQLQPLPEKTDSPAQTKQALKPPAFFDQKKGQIKDLPNFPNASVINMSYGPMNEMYMMSLFLQTFSSFQEVTAFYDKAIESNGWTVTNNSRAPGSYVWQLKKGEGQEAKVQVKEDPDARRVIIGLLRTEKQPGK
jgi:hypothetical protein